MKDSNAILPNPDEGAQAEAVAGEERRKHPKIPIRSVVFLLVLALVVYHLQGVFAYDDVYTHENRVAMTREKKGRLDGVYIGGSDVYYFWQPLFGWTEFGIAVGNYCSNSMRASSVKHYLIEAQNRQPDALYILSINTFKTIDDLDLSSKIIHRNVDYLPLSLNTLRLTRKLTARNATTGLDDLEYYLPIIRFHSRWADLKPWSFGVQDNDYKASLHAMSFLSKSMDVSEQLACYDDADAPLSDDMKGIVEDLLDYCDAHRLNVLFVKVPQAVSQEVQGRMNRIEAMVTERGYPCLDLFDKTSEMGIDLRQEWWDEHHLDIHGSLKFSRTLGAYLMEHYQFQDKRDLPEWSDWDRSATQYAQVMRRYLLPFEIANDERIMTDIPALAEPSVTKQSVTVNWGAVEGANGYVIYRKCALEEDRAWREVAEADANSQSWVDEDVAASTSYTYTVVPVFTADDKRVYGSFDIIGISATTEGEPE